MCACRAGTGLPRIPFPPPPKLARTYANSQLIRMEASINGYTKGLALDEADYMSEGSDKNIFLVRDGKIATPPLSASVLPGITRDMFVTVAQSLGIPIVKSIGLREMLYTADEVFFSGIAVEITPIRSVDGIVNNKGESGPVTEKIQCAFFDVSHRRTGRIR